MPPQLRIEPARGGVRVLTISHPEKKGALNHELLVALDVALDAARREGVRALLIRGEAGAFSAGYDLSAIEPATDPDALPDTYLGQVLSKLQHLPIPTVAVVDGPAFGAGCELACACDFRVGDAAARFCMPPARLGIVYSLDGLARVARLVGLQRARRMFLTADRIHAPEAHAWGLLDLVAEEGKAFAQAHELGERLADLAPLAIAGMKESLGVLETPLATAAQRTHLEALRREAFTSRDAAEGIAAFLERRAAKFEGR
jgi:enoyl-CoA hydratase/carnithine racemase